MTLSTDLVSFVKEGLQRGIPRSQIDEALSNAGWERDQVRAALNHFAEVDFQIPVPRPVPSLDARDAFLCAVMFGALYFGAYQLGSLVFELIDRAFPDAAARAESAVWADMALRWSLASVIVAFPVFLLVARLTTREQQGEPTKRISRVRRNLTYLTLFVAAMFLVGDVTMLVYNLLGGEMTIRFTLKVLTVAIIAGAGFGHYLRELRVDEHAAARGRAA